MSDSPNEKEKDSDNEKVSIEPVHVLSNIPGVGPKTAEKLVESGYDDLKKITTADPAKLAEAIIGLSIPKAEGVIEEAKTLLKDIESGAVDITGKAKKSKRKKAPEPEPEKHELPPMEEIAPSESRTSLESGFEKDKADMGIPIGPKSLTKFEKARIIGARALQISMGAPVLIDSKKAPKGLFALAEVELKSGALPMTVRRTLPTGEFADVALSILLKSTRLG